jgi:hypothetical protein
MKVIDAKYSVSGILGIEKSSARIQSLWENETNV